MQIRRKAYESPFPQQDMLTKHDLTIHLNGSHNSSRRDHKPSQRLLIACVACARAKTRCDKNIPTCTRCVTKGLICKARETKRFNEVANRLALRQRSQYRMPVPIIPAGARTPTTFSRDLWGCDTRQTFGLEGETANWGSPLLQDFAQHGMDTYLSVVPDFRHGLAGGVADGVPESSNSVSSLEQSVCSAPNYLDPGSFDYHKASSTDEAMLNGYPSHDPVFTSNAGMNAIPGWPQAMSPKDSKDFSRSPSTLSSIAAVPTFCTSQMSIPYGGWS